MSTWWHFRVHNILQLKPFERVRKTSAGET
jgi:hypothetical protein